MGEQGPVRVFFVPLGCAKNLVDSERMLHTLRQSGMEIVDDPDGADAAVVNTCGFIQSAQEEAIGILLRLAELKKQGRLRALVAAGCLPQRFQEEFLKELPEVDAAVGTGSVEDIAQAVRAALNGGRRAWFGANETAEQGGGRDLLTPAYSAYLRIAEGCDNRCAYCVIPYIRGPYRSRPMEELVQEARELAQNGCKELLVVAQDISRYGTDLYGKRCLHTLLQELCQIDGIEWIRLHYLYPDELDDELLDVIEKNPRILHYFDIPIQHISDRVLRDMNRRGGGELVRERIRTIRRRMPDAVIRTSLIVGFPGETEEEFQELCDFLCEYRLERAGVFAFSPEEGAPAASMPGQIDDETKNRRQAEVFALQQDIMNECSAALIGQELTVLCCGVDESGRQYGRSYMDSPDVDGVVFFDEETPEGQFVRVRILDAAGCELFGEKVGE